MLGDLGGCLGLCLGASIVTVLELIEFCFSALSGKLIIKTGPKPNKEKEMYQSEPKKQMIA